MTQYNAPENELVQIIM